jgi:hypothetical protein
MSILRPRTSLYGALRRDENGVIDPWGRVVELRAYSAGNDTRMWFRIGLTPQRYGDWFAYACRGRRPWGLRSVYAAPARRSLSLFVMGGVFGVLAVALSVRLSRGKAVLRVPQGGLRSAKSAGILPSSALARIAAEVTPFHFSSKPPIVTLCQYAILLVS